MIKLAILTPTHRPDFEYFRELHASVLRHTSDEVTHHIIVPVRDVALFSELDSPRLKIHTTREFLPRGFLPIQAVSDALRWIPGFSTIPLIRSISRGELFVNVRRPWVPIRGWILQQLVKLEAVSRLDADVVLMADSDVALIRPVEAAEFVRDGAVRFYKKPSAVTSDLPRHIAWHDRARQLLGLQKVSASALPDYISSFLAWDPKIVKRVQERITETSNSNWASVISKEKTLSEWTIYGVYVDHLGEEKDRSFTVSDSICHSHWDVKPIISSDVKNFVDSIGEDDVAVLIQSTSGTSLEVRRNVIAAAEERFNDY
ncbi:DUF6492 family protein [Microvirga aerophila]|uniref:DUF6492 family protein n=1 Tax=Microvirga aerophila TaxID=670291 RepID=UPI0011BF8ED1|nr:DUF6492 family protein [Microvirga aerophila]